MPACNKLAFPLEKHTLGVLRADVGGVKIDSSREGQPVVFHPVFETAWPRPLGRRGPLKPQAGSDKFAFARTLSLLSAVMLLLLHVLATASTYKPTPATSARLKSIGSCPSRSFLVSALRRRTSFRPQKNCWGAQATCFCT